MHILLLDDLGKCSGILGVSGQKTKHQSIADTMRICKLSNFKKLLHISNRYLRFSGGEKTEVCMEYQRCNVANEGPSLQRHPVKAKPAFKLPKRVMKYFKHPKIAYAI